MKKRFLSIFLSAMIFLSFSASAAVIVKKDVPAKQKQTATPLLPKVVEMPFRIPEIQRVVSKNGIEAWLIEEKSTPVIAMTVLFQGGKASDPKRLTGLSAMTAALLDEGAGKYRAEEFQERLAQKAISLSFGATMEYMTAGLETLRDNKDEAFDLFRLALTKPRFDRKAIRRQKERTFAVIQAREGNPDFIAYRRWNKLVYKDHPYGHSIPDKKTVRAVTRHHMKKLIKDRFAKNNMKIGVAGNISAAELAALLDKTFDALPDRANIADIPPFVPQLTARTDVLSMDIPQSAVLFGHQGLQRNDPDFYAALLVNYTFGSGGFASRLFKEVREKNGLAYSVGTELDIDKTAPMISGSVGSDNAKLSAAIDIIKAEWKKMADKGPTVKELNDAKTFLTGSFPLTFSSTEGLASFMAGLQYYGLGIDYLQKRNGILNAVTPEQARKVAKRLYLPDNLFFVVVGKPANL